MERGERVTKAARNKEPKVYTYAYPLPLAADDEVHCLQHLRLEHFLRLQGYQNPHNVCVGTSQSLRETPRVRNLSRMQATDPTSVYHRRGTNGDAGYVILISTDINRILC